MKIHIKEFTENDAGELEDLFKKVWPESREYPEEWRKKRQLTREEITTEMHSGFHYFGARNEKGEITGVYKLKVTEEGCFGEHQSILPECTGDGIASAMYEQFINYATTHKCIKNYVYILETHFACIHLVEKYGFYPVGDTFEQAEGMWVQKYERRCHE